MKITSIPSLLTASHLADDALLLTGPHGIGKTEIAIEWAKSNNIYLEILYLSNQEVGDLIGNTRTVELDGEFITTWTKPIWLHKLEQAAAKGIKTAVFLDEFSRATLDVRQSALQLVLDRRIHQHSLPIVDGYRTFIIAADNPDDGEYQVESLDSALVDRFLNIEVEVDVNGWLEYARRTNINTIVTSFIMNNPAKLCFNRESSPRGWVKLAKYVDNFENTDPELYYPIIVGKIGKSIAAQFLNYYDNYKKMIGIPDIEKLAMEMKAHPHNIIGEGIKELTKEMEVVQLSEIAYTLIEKYIDSDNHSVMMGFLYSLNVEVLAAIITKLSKDDRETFNKIVKIDEVNKKLLFSRMADNIKL